MKLTTEQLMTNLGIEEGKRYRIGKDFIKVNEIHGTTVIITQLNQEDQYQTQAYINYFLDKEIVLLDAPLTAEEMFKECNYTKQLDSLYFIVYTAPHPWLEYRIIFDKKEKNYYCCMLNPELQQNEGYIFLTPELHAAIHQQLIELGWIKC